jgi:hypothetical protein
MQQPTFTPSAQRALWRSRLPPNMVHAPQHLISRHQPSLSSGDLGCLSISPACPLELWTASEHTACHPKPTLTPSAQPISGTLDCSGPKGPFKALTSPKPHVGPRSDQFGAVRAASRPFGPFGARSAGHLVAHSAPSRSAPSPTRKNRVIVLRGPSPAARAARAGGALPRSRSFSIYGRRGSGEAERGRTGLRRGARSGILRKFTPRKTVCALFVLSAPFGPLA